MLTECVNCGFYVKRDDEFCLNCGIESPSKEFSEPSTKIILLLKIIRLKFTKITCSLILMLILLYAIADWSFSNIIYLRDYLLFLGLIFGIGFSLLSMSLLENWCFDKLHPKRQKKPDSFLSRIKLIDKRLSELDKRGKAIDLILSRINAKPSQELKNIRPKILEAREIVISQSARYKLQAKKIELVRLQNSVSLFLFGWQQLNKSETEKGIVIIEDTQQRIGKIRQNLAGHDSIELPEKILPEKQNFFSQLDETEMSCEKLRDALLSRQAAHALQEVSLIEENLKLARENEIVEAAETFNIQTTLTDFSESFAELEYEYKRLKSEEIEAKLLENQI